LRYWSFDGATIIIGRPDTEECLLTALGLYRTGSADGMGLYPWSVVLLAVTLESDDKGAMDIKAVVALELLLALRSK